MSPGLLGSYEQLHGEGVRRVLCTAATTRAGKALIVVGRAETVRAAARWERSVARRTGLRSRLHA